MSVERCRDCKHFSPGIEHSSGHPTGKQGWGVCDMASDSMNFADTWAMASESTYGQPAKLWVKEQFSCLMFTPRASP